MTYGTDKYSQLKVVTFKESSFIKNISWDSNTESLLVGFNSGTTWVYYNVPENIYNDLLKASSVGTYFNKVIRDNYPSQRINYKLNESRSVQKEEKA